MTVLETLKDSIGTGKLITVIYHGGSQPGTTREILPMQITGNKIRARCYQSNAVKTFIIDKMEICQNPQNTQITFDNTKIGRQTYSSIKDVHNQLKEYLTSIGWHVEIQLSQNLEVASLSLHGYFKNGKIRKTPELQINYNKYTTESVFDGETGDFTERLKEMTRPYYVKGRTFGKIDHAVEVFLEGAQKGPEHKPANR